MTPNISLRRASIEQLLVGKNASFVIERREKKALTTTTTLIALFLPPLLQGETRQKAHFDSSWRRRRR